MIQYTKLLINYLVINETSYKSFIEAEDDLLAYYDSVQNRDIKITKKLRQRHKSISNLMQEEEKSLRENLEGFWGDDNKAIVMKRALFGHKANLEMPDIKPPIVLHF